MARASLMGYRNSGRLADAATGGIKPIASLDDYARTGSLGDAQRQSGPKGTMAPRNNQGLQTPAAVPQGTVTLVPRVEPAVAPNATPAAPAGQPLAPPIAGTVQPPAPAAAPNTNLQWTPNTDLADQVRFYRTAATSGINPETGERLTPEQSADMHRAAQTAEAGYYAAVHAAIQGSKLGETGTSYQATLRRQHGRGGVGSIRYRDASGKQMWLAGDKYVPAGGAMNVAAVDTGGIGAAPTGRAGSAIPDVNKL